MYILIFVLTSAGITDDKLKDYKDILGNLITCQGAKEGLIHDLTKNDKQRERLQSNMYIVVLYNLTSNCNYGEMQKQWTRDGLVLGIRNSLLSEQLQLNPELTLEKIKSHSAKKAVWRQKSVLSSDPTHSLISIMKLITANEIYLCNQAIRLSCSNTLFGSNIAQNLAYDVGKVHKCLTQESVPP